MIAKNDLGESFFFKGSKTLPDDSVRYPLEFWSEIAASKIGQFLGFDVLDYNIGYNAEFSQGIGCLSRSMVENSHTALSEGKDYLSGYDSTYNPVKDENRYTIDFIAKSIIDFELESEIPKLIETMVFDALIGNSDRHQENWGFIMKYNELLEELDKAIRDSGLITKVILKFFRWSISQSPKYLEKSQESGIRFLRSTLLRQSQIAPTQYSPIYDSGCCLGRELEDSKIDDMLRQRQQIESYVNRGRSEIRLEVGNKKPKHFDVVRHLKANYEEETIKAVNRVSELYKKDAVREIVERLDVNLPEHLSNHKLPENRKQLMLSLIDLRVQRLVSI